MNLRILQMFTVDIYIMKPLKILFFAFTCFIIMSCRGFDAKNYTEYKIASFDQIVFLIYSPYNCYSKIVVNKAGVGVIIEFVKKETGDSLISSYSFPNMSSSDILQIDEDVALIKAKDSIYSPRMHDTFNYQLFVDDKKYVDFCGSNKIVNNLLRVFHRYSKGSDDHCGFFRLFEETL